MTYLDGSVKMVEVGYLKKQEVKAYMMDRERFKSIVSDLIGDNDDLRKEIMPVAETIERFPFGTWVNERGCGCLVGEYLIARAEVAEVTRQQFVTRNVRYDSSSMSPATVMDLLCGNPLAHQLETLGLDIDNKLRRIVEGETMIVCDSRGREGAISCIVIVD